MMNVSYTDADDEEGNGARLDPHGASNFSAGRRRTENLQGSISIGPSVVSSSRAVSGISIELAKVKLWLADCCLRRGLGSVSHGRISIIVK